MKADSAPGRSTLPDLRGLRTATQDSSAVRWVLASGQTAVAVCLPTHQAAANDPVGERERTKRTKEVWAFGY